MQNGSSTLVIVCGSLEIGTGVTRCVFPLIRTASPPPPHLLDGLLLFRRSEVHLLRQLEAQVLALAPTEAEQDERLEALFLHQLYHLDHVVR